MPNYIIILTLYHCIIYKHDNVCSAWYAFAVLSIFLLWVHCGFQRTVWSRHAVSMALQINIIAHLHMYLLHYVLIRCWTGAKYWHCRYFLNGFHSLECVACNLWDPNNVCSKSGEQASWKQGNNIYYWQWGGGPEIFQIYY